MGLHVVHGVGVAVSVWAGVGVEVQVMVGVAANGDVIFGERIKEELLREAALIVDTYWEVKRINATHEQIEVIQAAMFFFMR